MVIKGPILPKNQKLNLISDKTKPNTPNWCVWSTETRKGRPPSSKTLKFTISCNWRFKSRPKRNPSLES
ncbi:hypothetical protein Hanom_Chr00s117464g01810271 [Helianthus anomalus]